MKELQLIFLLLITSHLFAQKNHENKDFRTVNINSKDSVIICDILIGEKKVKLEQDCFYYWYRNNYVYITQADYDGTLLHGNYKVYNPDNEIVTKGVFHLGVKNGEWKQWYPDGVLKSVEIYKNGKLDGEAVYFNSRGSLYMKQKYKDGVLIPEKNKEQVNTSNTKNEKTTKEETNKKERKKWKWFRKKNDNTEVKNPDQTTSE